MGTLFVDNLKHQSSQGSGTITLGASGETIALASGASVTGNGLVGITMADQFRITANITSDTYPISSNLEQVDTAPQGTLGTGMSVSSGYWTFPSTGIYLVRFCAYVQASNDNVRIFINGTTDNSNYVNLVEAYAGANAARHQNAIAESLVDVTDTTNVKINFGATSITSPSIIHGNTDRNESYMTFIRLGDT